MKMMTVVITMIITTKMTIIITIITVTITDDVLPCRSCNDDACGLALL